MAAKLDEHYVPIDINTYDPTAGTYTVSGVIENRDDYDMFSFVSHGGTYVVDVAGAGADHRFIDGDFSWNYIRHADVENAVFAGKYYASSYDYANLNVKVELLDENGEIVLLDMDGKIQKLGYGESIVLSDNYYYYVVDQFGKKVYNADGSLKEGYQAVDDSTYTTFSHFVTPELEAGKTYYISVTGVGQGNDATNGFSDYGSLGQYTLSMHESYENFYVDAEKMDVESLEYATGVDNVLNWQEAFVYSGRRLEDGSRHLGNTLTFDASLSGQTLDLRETLRFTFSRPIVDQPFSEKRFVLDATAAWDAENDRPGITIDANEKFRVLYVDNTTVELYGFTFTGGVAETTNVIYLYFGGIDGPGWSGEDHPAYDLDGDPTTFNDAELEAINEIYLRVVEDYAPFNVTVTTDQDVFNAATNAIRVVIGGTGNDRGGVAYLNSFGTQKQDCYVFPNSLGSPKAIAEAISHEVGHTFNLSHDGQDTTEYYGGTNGWAPIMGVGYYQALTQWSKGEYQGATQTQDDLAYIAARLGYKDDDHSDKRANATALRESYIRSGNFVADGLIERTGDVDMFSFVATDSTYVIDVVGSGADYDNANAAGYAASLGYTNLDLRVELYDDAGNLLYTCDPTDSLFAHFEATGLTAGDSYFIRVTTTGRGNPATDGYSNYGAVGQYYVTVSAGTNADFVGEERYTSVATRNAVNEGALNATKEKGETYGKNGQTNNGGGIYNNYGWLTIGDSVIAGNRALKAGGGVYNSGGEYEDGGQHDGWLYLVNTSIVGNVVTEANSVGGGLYNESGAVATLVNVTVAGNTADYSGGGIQNAGRVNLYNSIVAENEASYGADVYTQSGKTTRAENSVIGDESRNSNYTAYKNGTNSVNVNNSSFIGTSRGSSVSSAVTTYDPKFVSYRGYDVAEWSSELWKSWNLRLQGDSLAVDLGNSANLTNDLDFGNGVSNGYNRWNQDRYFFTEDYQTDLAGQPRFEGDSVDAGAYEVLGKADLKEFIPSAAGSDVVNDWESSIVISRAEDDQTGSIAPFLVDENLFLNLSFINQGAAIADSFETTVYMWKYDPKTSTKQQMFADSKIGNKELALLNVKVDFAEGVSMPGGDGSAVATITLTNLATGAVETIEYDGANSYISLTNVALGSIEEIIGGFVENGVLEAQNEEGYYVFGYQLDSGAALDEYSETNNFYLTTSYFDVVESPVSVNNSIVVTTTEDVVDAYDGEISLREAVEIYAGSFYYREVALPEGATFESGGVTYTVKGGKFYVDNTTDYRVYPGESFSFTEAVSETIVWNAEQSAYVDAEGNVVALTNGDKATFTLDGVEYVDAQWDEAASAWIGDGYSFAATDVVEATLNREAVVTVVYAEDVYFDADNKAIAVSDGTKGEIDGVAVEMVDGVWTSVSQTSYNRDQVQAMGNFFLADGSEVAVVNGVFRRVATNDVAVVLDGSTVTLANGESAVYDAAKGVFVVTTTVEYPMSEGAKVVVDGVELTFVERAYVDSGDYRYYLTDGVVVTLANGYEVEYNARRDAFVFKSENVAGKIDAGSTILWEGETYSYKAGVAIVQKVSRETNAVVFDAALDGQTFVLTQGELTLTTSFTLDCVDPNGELLDLTIQGVNSRLFTVETGASVEIKNFKLANSTSSQDGGVVYNKGTLTVDSVAFSGNESNGGVGGSIYNASGATLSVSNSTFSGDSARDGASIYNAGSATIQDSTFDATGEVGNGVLYNVGTLVVDNTQFNGGSTASMGGALYNAGTADVSNSTFDGTAALNGGAIYNAANGTLRLADSDFANVSASFGGAIYNAGNATVDGGSFVGAAANERGGAFYNAGTATITDSLFDGASATLGGAIYNSSDMRLYCVEIVRSEAERGAAIYSTGGLTVSNSLIAKNVATGRGGAIYNVGTATLTNATIADNQAADGAGLYNVGTANLNNTILAENQATGAAAKGFDLYTAEGATTTLRSSLLGNVAQYGDKAFELDAAYRSFLGVDPQFVDAENGDYTLSVTSPAINNGSNDLSSYHRDFAGKARRVGLTVGGVVMSVDMGAFEYQAIIAPDLDVVDSSVDYWQTEKLENGETVELDYFVAGQDVCVDFNVQNVGDAAVYSNFGYTMTLVGTNDKGEVVYTKTQDIRYYASSFDRFDWLNESDWIAADGSASLAANLGALPAGRYSITLTLDVDGVGKVVEYGEQDGFSGENNNVYTGTFNVFEAPSSVVTTEQDVVDPTDGLTSIREAIANAGAYEYVSIFMVADGTQYVLEDGQIVTVENGSLTVKVDVVEKNGVLVDLQDGDQFLLNGRPIYYRAQLNGGYFAYSMEEGAERADVSSGEVTFPDGAAANLQLNTDQYVSFVDGTNLNPSEGDRYSYQTLVFPNGDKVILTDGAAFEYANVKFTYCQNDQYPDGAFVFENGDVVSYADGGSLEFANLSVGTLQTRNEVYRDELILADGSKIQVIDGVARLTKSVEPTVTFAESMQGKTITVDATAGPIEIADVVVIDGEDRDVTLDGANSTGIFLVQEGGVATISRLTATRGAGAVGGAVVNRGELTLNDVDFADNNVRLTGTPTDGELTSGLGGAIYNVGTLSVNGGTFENNFASEFGGAIFSKGELVVKNASFVGGSSFAGGAISAQAGTLAVENTTFTNNVAEVGGAVYTLVDATFVAVSFVGNQATNGNGGAIYAGPQAAINFAAAGESTLAVSFEGNKATGNGGAFYTENDVVVAGDLVAKNNEAGDGAALYIGGSLTVDGLATIAGNKSTTSALIAKIVEIKGDLTLEANESANAALESAGAVAVGGSATITGNKTGGAISAQGAVSFGGDLTAKNNVATDGAVISGTTFNVGGAATFENNESTTGAVLVGGAVEIAGALSATGNKATAGSIISGSTIIVGADATLANNESTTGALTANEAVEFGGTLTATGNVATDGAIISGSAIKVVGDATLANNESTTGVLTTAGAVDLGGALSATGNVATDGAIISGSAIKVVGDATLANNESTTGVLTTAGAVDLGGALSATGNVATDGAIISGSAIKVVGDATLANNESTTGAVLSLGDVEIGGALTAENNKATSSGGAIAAVGAVSVVGDATLTGNEAGASGGAIAANGAVSFGGALNATNNKAVGSGGAILSGAGVSVVGDATLTGNTAGGAGGAIVAQNVEIGGSLTASGNSAATGGAIYATGAVEIDGSLTATNNAATALAGGVIASASSVSVGGDATLTGNSAQGSGGAIAAVQNVVIVGAAKAENNAAGLAGGAIAADGSVEIGGDATFANNSAQGAGGALVALGDVSLGGSATLTGNSAGEAGGAISANGSLEIVGALTASDNTAGGFGGAIAVGGGVSVGADATLTGNEAAFSGGAIYAKDGDVEITGVLSAENNKAGAQAVEINSTVETTTLEDGTVVETTVKTFATDGFGGAIAAPNGDVSVVGDATLTGNSSAGYGGAVYAGGAVSFGGSATLSNNEAKDATATVETTVVTTPVEGDATTETTSETLVATVGRGGAIAANAAFEVVGSLTATNNKATENGGAISANGAITVGGDAILSGNEGAVGGAMLSLGDVVIGGALTAENNKATVSGGAISAVGSLTVGGDATLTGNEAAQIGGSLAANGAVSLGGSLTATNNAATVGGAILSGAGVSVEGDATLTGNTAAGAGGAIAATQNVEIVGALTANDNKAANGGAISANGDVVIGGALTAANNEATGTAGGVIVSGASVSVGGDATLTGNSAQGSGGAIAAVQNVVIVGAAKAENNAAGLAGGAIAADGSVEIGGDATFANNSAQGAGGALVALGDVSLGGSATLTGNSAGEAGGAISANGSLEIVGALTASDNTAGGFGGAIAVGGGVSVGADATLTGNEAAFSGGAIYAKDGDVEIVGALVASDNAAGSEILEIETTETETLEDGTTVVTTVKTTIVDGFGGAIAAPNGDVSVGGDATLTGNATNGLGGAIYAENATFGGDAKFEDNVAISGSQTVVTTVVTTPVEGDATTETTEETTKLLASGGAVYAGAVEIAGALTAKDNAATDAGGAIYASSLNVVGSATLTGGTASDGGAVYSTGSVAIGGTLTAIGNVAYQGGAFNVETLTVEGLAKLTGNQALDGSGGAIYASTVALKDGALLADNVATENGGAVYAQNLTLVSATVAGNSAANGGALYVGESATLDNTIVAGNAATGEGVDVYVAEAGTITLRNSLLQNIEVGAGELVLVEEYRSFLGVDPQFNDDYTLKATSPAINAGSNALAGASDVDLAGASRYVGLTVDGEIYAIDMGAFEYQTVAAPNLTFAENPVNFWYASVNGEKKDYYIFGEDVVLDFSFLNAPSTLAEVGSGMVVDKFSVSFVVEGVAANGETISQTFEYRYQPESDYFDWLSAGDWLDADELVSYARQNLGVLPVGNYSLSISLDVNDEIVERGEEDGSEAANDNVYTTSFEVREAPSTVVTTDKDVVDPTDDLISLREAVEVYAGSYWYSSTILVEDGAEYLLDDLTQVVVKDGNATVSRDVATLVESQTTLRDGDKFAFGSSYMTFENGVVTYPDGAIATYDGENPLTFQAADGTTYVVKPESYYDYIQNTQQPVADPNVATVDVIIMPNGDMIALEHFEQTEFYYGETFATYYELAAVDAEGNAISFAEGATLVLDGKAGVYQNGAVVFEDGSFARLTDGSAIEINGVAATFVGAAFVLPTGEVVEFVAGETLVCENGSTVAMSQVDEIVSGVLDFENGRRVEFLGDGSANVSTQVGTDVTFAANLDNATIKLESAITVDRDLTINAADRANVSVSGANQTNVFVIAEGATATITSLTVEDAVAKIGAGVANYGTLSLVDVSISGTKATSEADEPFADKILTEGVGAAIYNAGTLSVDGGSFANNVSTFHGGAIYSVGSLAIKNATFEGNVSEYYGGAIYVQDGTATIDSSVFKGNKAQYGGAVATMVSLKAANSIFTENIGTLGGALYAWGPNASIEATQSTLIANVAEQGGAIYVADAALTLKNSIVATNEATESATDIALVGSATATVYASLIGVADDCGDGTLNFDAGPRSFYGTSENPVDPALDAEGRTTVVSPALNSGSNAFATATDGSALSADASGADRVVGVEKDGAIYSVDMGALEFQTVAAPDLGFYKEDGSAFLNGQEKPVAGFTLSLSGFGGEGFSNTGDFVEGWDVSFAVGYGNAGNAYCFESFAVELKTVRLDADGNAIAGTETVVTRVFGDESGYFNVEDWLASGEAFVELWNLGAAYEAGQYKLTLTVDAADSVVELDETNNVFEANFAVRERPSLVVTTERDVVNPYDGETSLREAIANVGADGSVGMKLNEVLAEGETFVLAENAALGVPAGAVATYADGKITLAVGEETIELAQGVEVALADGTTFAWQVVDGFAVATRGDSIGSAITFAESVYGKTIELTSELTIDRSLTIDGTDANVVVSGASASRIATVARGTVSVFGLTFENGSANLGGAIYNAANLTLTNVSVKNSSATEDGGAIYNALGGELTLTNVDILGAAATNGGAIYNAGNLFGEEVAISGANAAYGAGLYNVGEAVFAGVSFVDGVATAQGGAIYNDGGELVVDDASFVGNQAVYGGAVVNYQGSATIVGATFASNKATGSAGAIDNYGDLALDGVVFENNEAAVAGGAIYNSESASNADAYSVALSDVVFNGNSASTGGAIYNAKGSVVEATGAVSFEANSATNEGGAIYNAGTATFANGATFSANSASTGGAIYNAGTTTLTGAKFDGNVATADGGAVANVGTFYATASEFVANEANGFGGAIYNLGKASLANALVAQNVATDGGAIANVKGATLDLRNATIAANVATTAGGVHNLGALNAYNTIIAANSATTAADLYSNGSAKLLNSLVGSTEGIGTKPSATNSLFDVDPGFAVAPVFNGDGTLANGDALDLRLVYNSVAVDAGNNAYAKDATGTTTLSTDLDGDARVATKLANVDMGAYEFQFEEPSTVVTTDLDVVDVTDGKISLREAIEYAAQLGESTVTFAEGLSTINLNSTLELDKSITIDASDVGGVWLDANGFADAASAIAINEGAKVSLVSLTITNSSANAQDWLREDNDRPEYSGGAVWNAGELTLRDATITGNVAAYGGGLYNLGVMRVYNSTIANNVALYYGGIYNRGELYVENSTIAGNQAAYNGGGVSNFAAATLVGTAIIGNRAETGAGVLALANVSGSRIAPETTLTNCTVAGNVATSAGGGVWANDVLNVVNTIVAGNAAASAADVYLANSADADVRYSLVGASNAKISGVGVKTNADPNFVDFAAPTAGSWTANAWKAWNLELAVGSPAIDAGSNALAVDGYGVKLTTDLAGDKRVVGAAVDMGAYEEQGNVAPTGIVVEFNGELTTETLTAGAVVATLTTEDANGDEDVYEYELLGASDYFAIDGDKIVATQDVPAGSYELVVRSTDQGGKSVETTVQIVVVNPGAENYAAPTITSVATGSETALEVFWATDDPAKEYVVSYRVGDGDWVETNALTGEHGTLEGDFNVGDVVQVRIRAVGGVDKNGSDWSEVETYVVTEAPKAFDVTTNGNGALVTLTIDSNLTAVAYWRIAWGDGTETVVNELSTQRVFGHVYAASGDYEMKLFVNNDEVGYDLGVFEAVVASSAVLETLTAETTNVFSAIAPVAVENVAPQAEEIAVSAALLADETVAWNEIAESLAVETTVETGVALSAAPATRAERAIAVYEALGAAFAELGADEFEAVDVDFAVEEANETAFDDAFLSELFGD